MFLLTDDTLRSAKAPRTNYKSNVSPKAGTLQNKNVRDTKTRNTHWRGYTATLYNAKVTGLRKPENRF